MKSLKKKKFEKNPKIELLIAVLCLSRMSFQYNDENDLFTWLFK